MKTMCYLDISQAQVMRPQQSLEFHKSCQEFRVGWKWMAQPHSIHESAIGSLHTRKGSCGLQCQIPDSCDLHRFFPPQHCNSNCNTICCPMIATSKKAGGLFRCTRMQRTILSEAMHQSTYWRLQKLLGRGLQLAACADFFKLRCSYGRRLVLSKQLNQFDLRSMSDVNGMNHTFSM